ncbi:MAG: DUF3159 domain-containing protein [Pseudonocardia sp.]
MAPSDPAPRAEPAVGGPSLREVLGGRGGAVDASVPVVVFVIAWLVAEAVATPLAVAWAAGAALASGIVVAGFRFVRGERPRAVLLGLLGVVAAAGVALWTGRAVDFFLLQMVGNAASALVWAVSIVVRWPLLGVVVGTVLGQRARWRRDPALLRAYQRASWVWVAQYLVRLAVFIPLYLAGAVVALGVARVALTAPLVFACVVVSWWVLRAALPAGHPGLRHPQG